MPYIKLKLVEGRDIETKRTLVKNVTDAVCESLHTTNDNVRIELIELQKDLFSIGGQLVEEKEEEKS
ncbi:hypothetical protein GCM10027286_00480 [Virgibacillus ainsalahensis]